MDTTDIITTTIPEFCRISGIGRSKTYEMIATGDLESILCGGRRLILIDSWRRYVDGAPRDLRARSAATQPARLRTAPSAAS
jgi:hypothetical protein